MTQRVNFYTDTYDVYIGRPGKGMLGKFGNPFKDGTKEENIARFRELFYRRISIDPSYKIQIEALRDKRLACFCPRGTPCHGDVYVEYFETNASPDVDEILRCIG